ncbi:MAG: serine/threonine protein kinase [Cyanobacteria bacterium SBLK]|nr:serine/threonine protein kinase [Cyanobacteria bacterium SBLK]
MSYCLNPQCQKPENAEAVNFCQSCGGKILLRDRYRAIKPIGSGSFGKTFLAIDEDKPSKPHCVIKQFSPQARDPDSIEKASELFAREATRLDELGDHDQIPNLFAHFYQDKEQYLVQEFIEGENLDAVLKNKGKFDETQIREFLKSLLPVLQFIHQRKVIHRDIKLENIIQRKTGELVLVDFGAATGSSATSLKGTGTVIGTMGYAPPEQILGKPTYASDIYSLGVTCLCLLTGMDPLDIYDPEEEIWRWRDRGIATVSAELGYILDKMVESTRRQRYCSAEEILQDLNPVPEDPTIPVSPPKSAIAESSSESTWQKYREFAGHEHQVYSISFNPKGKMLASGSRDSTIKLWSLSTGRLLQTLKGHATWVNAVAFDRTGQVLASGSGDKTIKLWSIGTGRQIQTISGYSHSVDSLDFNVNGRILACAGDGKTVTARSTKTGKVLQVLTGHQSYVNCVAFSPIGNIAASASCDKTARLWNVKTGRLLHVLVGHEGWLNAVVFSPDGELLATGSVDRAIALWSVRSGKLLQKFSGHLSKVYALAFSPDGKLLVSGGGDGIKLWSVKTGKELSGLGYDSEEIYTVAFNPGGNIVAGGGKSKIVLWKREN